MKDTEEEICYFDESFKKIEFLFRWAGLNIRSKPQTRLGVIKTRLVFINQWIWLNIDLGGAIYWFMDGLINGQDFLSLTYIAPCISLTAMSSLKVVLMFKKENVIHKLMDKMRTLEHKDKERKESQIKKDIINIERNYLHIALTTSNILFLFCVFFFTISPMILMWLHYSETNEVELILPFLILYPFDPYNVNVYPFVFIHQCFSELIVLFNFGSADYFLYICCTYIRIQFKLLQHHITHDLLVSNNSEQIIRADEVFKAKFKDLVTWHQELFQCVEIMEEIYSNSILLNCISSSLTICLTGFNATNITDIAFVFSFACLLIFGLIQIFLLCIFADLLRTASIEVSDAVYTCNWYKADIKVVKSLLIMHIRAQRPCKLTAAGFADVTLNSFMRILSTSWSYFALLQTLYGN